jgi:AbrB family looped-hinge helix DNA binding protein
MLKFKKQATKPENGVRLETTIDATGAVILPKLVMKYLDLKTGDKIVIAEESGKIIMRKT